MNEYTVTFTYTSEITSKTETIQGEYKTEREAVRQIGHVKRVSNLELVSHSENIDRAKYRY